MMVTGEDQHGQPGVDKGQRAASEVEGWRDLALEVSRWLSTCAPSWVVGAITMAATGRDAVACPPSFIF
jgi:hypothetical protein